LREVGKMNQVSIPTAGILIKILAFIVQELNNLSLNNRLTKKVWKNINNRFGTLVLTGENS
jgi:uncharacterized membrane protein